MEHHLKFLTKIFDYTDVKVRFATFWGGVGSTAFSFLNTFAGDILGISFGLLILLFFIMLCDYFTGLQASMHEKKVFSSKRGLSWVFKLGFYMITLAVSLALRKETMLLNLEWLSIPHYLLHYYILIHIISWELKSIDENMDRLGHSIKILKLFDKIALMFTKIIEKKIDNENDQPTLDNP